MSIIGRQFESEELILKYLKHRPRYTQEIFDIIVDYMKEKSEPIDSGRFPLALDVACGPGLMSTVYLTPYFDRIIGVDVSQAQIDQAKIHNKHRNHRVQISSRIDSPENPEFSIYNRLLMRRYTDSLLQIPYSDTTRRDDIYFNVQTTIVGFKGLYESQPYVCNFLQSKPENKEWWKSCFQRIMECCGAEDFDSPLTYRVTAFMLLGRKPLETTLSS